MTEAAAGDAGGVLPLPPGQPLPGEWVPVGSRRSEAEAGPAPNLGAGGEGAAGAGGVTWRLGLAPRHRAVVRRYFAGGAAPADGKEGR
ncbi:MAG: hypothetical protein KF830_16250 [Planctomycetes bacterium]|nr:hypothetical protein [Planctomycetota bacterium]